MNQDNAKLTGEQIERKSREGHQTVNGNSVSSSGINELKLRITWRNPKRILAVKVHTHTQELKINATWCLQNQATNHVF